MVKNCHRPPTPVVSSPAGFAAVAASAWETGSSPGSSRMPPAGCDEGVAHSGFGFGSPLQQE